tara:strand:+ start:70287 stop:72299 length:2013 start_codon:yes stop_codon:yes gene_type:complete
MNFSLKSDFLPTGDQPEAIKELYNGFKQNEKFMTLLGVTGSGKTFTVANIIQKLMKPTLILAHNKTLAAQLYTEFKQFFPDNAVEYFVSYYDYYQPEAYLPVTGTYIEKDLSINDEIEKLRLRTTSSLLSGRRDVIVIASVSCLYGIGNPIQFKENIINIKLRQNLSKRKLLEYFVQSLYTRSIDDFKKGNFRLIGDVIDIFPIYSDNPIKILFYGEEIEDIFSFCIESQNIIKKYEEIDIYPANIFVTTPKIISNALDEIQIDLSKQVDFFKKNGKNLEAKRLEERTLFDVEMIKELGYCSGIENYSRYLDGRKPGTRPFCLIDYFPDDFLMVIDESHVTIPQVHAMYGGDRSRKVNLVEYGFRLPAAMDNRPLKFEEFEKIQNQVLYVSATPADYELNKSDGIFTEQIIRPTGLLDPVIEVRASKNQIDDIIEEINKRVLLDERVLITTLTKKMAEELAKYFVKLNIRSKYIHSDIDTLERVDIMHDLRKGLFDVLVGVNLLREGLDLPEVSLVIILDADKEGFLRSNRSLTQTIGRAARNINGKAIMYADRVTRSMRETINKTKDRRIKQIIYNKKNNITPEPLKKSINNILVKESITNSENEKNIHILENKIENISSKNEIEKNIKNIRKEMEDAAKNLDFILAAKNRDLLNLYKQKLNKLKQSIK